jgi:hypothetical protein
MSPTYTSSQARINRPSPSKERLQTETVLSTPQQRRAAIVAGAIKQYRLWFDPEGHWVSPLQQPDARETIWGIFSLLQGDSNDLRLANAVLRHMEFSHHHPTRTDAEENSPFDIFVTNHCVQMLVLHGKKLEPDVLLNLEYWARQALADYPGDRQADYQFHGCNDNMPAKAALGMILGGEYFSDRQALEHGLWSLRQLRDLLTRRGLLSEYTSPTYSPLTLINLQEISSLSSNAEARVLAAQCVERIWADILGHFHQPTGIMGGPYSRAYQLDSTGHFSTVACLLWIVLGDVVALKPLEELARQPMRLVYHHNSRVTQWGILSWLSSCQALPPAYLLNWLNQRQYPFHLRASAERGFDESGEVNTTFHAEEDFALGTANNEAWSELQSETFFLQYRRHAPLRSIEDLRTAYCRYLINDQKPGDLREDHLLKPHGIIHTLQQERLALVVARPSLTLAGKDLTTLKLSLILPTHFRAVEKIEIRGNTVLIQDGSIYLGLRGLNPTNWGRQTDIGVESNPHYQLISFYNYQGPAKPFQADEIGRTLNGFISAVGLKSEESWENFCNRFAEMEVLDYFHFGSRTIRCKWENSLLGLSYSVKKDRVRYLTINGEIAPTPVWDADAMPPNRLPFLGKPQPNSLELPFQKLRAIWAPNDPWVISSTGTKPC